MNLLVYQSLNQIVSYMYILKARLGGFVYPAPDGGTYDLDHDLDINIDGKDLGMLTGFGGIVKKYGIPILTSADEYPKFVKWMKKVELRFASTKEFRCTTTTS